MAFGRRRRRPTVAWLPVLGQGENSARSYIDDGLAVAFNGDLVTAVHALTVDYPAEAVQNVQVESLADYQESGYRLRRIVGKFYCAANQYVGDGQVTAYPSHMLVGCGFIVLRVDPSTGAPLRASTPSYYNPLARDNIRDPWIWRRTWLLSNSFAVPAAQSVSGHLEYSRTNEEFGSMSDGPHIDARTARRISVEERLFMVVGTQWPGFGSPPNTDGGVVYTAEFRFLTSPLRVQGNKRNASR